MKNINVQNIVNIFVIVCLGLSILILLTGQHRRDKIRNSYPFIVDDTTAIKVALPTPEQIDYLSIKPGDNSTIVFRGNEPKDLLVIEYGADSLLHIQINTTLDSAATVFINYLEEIFDIKVDRIEVKGNDELH